MKKLIIILGLLGLIGSVHAKERTIVFGAGCFWGVEKHFENLDGVISAKAGYAGGNYPNPTYKKVLDYAHNETKGIVNHTETVQVVYEDQKVSTDALIRDFWELHNPTEGDRQGNDIGDNYRSAIYYTDKDQKSIALETAAQYQILLTKAGYKKITTEIKELDKFYIAEDFHQDYLKKNPNGYCPNHATGVKFDKSVKKQNFIMPLGGKEIVVIDSDGCPFCSLFKKDVSSSYHGDIPLRTVHKERLKNFEIKTNLDATPTILLIEDGKEVYSYRGYLNKIDFYKMLGAFKLGDDSEAFKVAFEQGTDGRFCKQYDKFKDTPDGVFVDRLSGDVLFDTKDRFNSHSGWLSFFKAVDGATIQKVDNSYGMKRVEVIAKTSGIHLGHVFDDAPGGKQRFCINATVLDFVAREKIQ